MLEGFSSGQHPKRVEASQDAARRFLGGVALEADNTPPAVTEYRVATTPEERTAALALSSRVYEKIGLKPSKTDVTSSEVNPFAEWIRSPDTCVFTASVGHDLVATLSVVRDGEKKLPMDQIYHAELEAFRAKKESLAEGSQLASDRELMRRLVSDGTLKSNEQPPIHLQNIAIRYVFGVYPPIDRFCIVCHPKHAKYYESMGFIRKGEEKHYEKVNNAAVLLTLDVKSLKIDMERGETRHIPVRLRHALGLDGTETTKVSKLH